MTDTTSTRPQMGDELHAASTRRVEVSARWFWRYRMDWIEEMLSIYGFINRAHIRRKFDVSEPQASNDLRDFQRVNPDRVRYDKTTKRYVAVTPYGKDNIND